ncbi:MAG: hypothetical protein ACU84H_03790 [Gammaproteobacteria bacterium]
MTTQLEASKARLRSIAKGQGRRWLEYPSTPNQAKINFLKASERLSERLKEAGTKIITTAGMGELETWTRRQPRQAACAAITAGFLAGRMRRSDVFFLNCLMQLLAAAADREN